jgi:hypothetical protein
VTRAAGYAAALAVAAAIATGCSTAVPGAATPNPAVKEAHIACVRATNDAVGTVKSWLSSIDTMTYPQLDSAQFRAMRVACTDEFIPAYSDFLARIPAEFTPVTVIGRAAVRQLMNQLCRNDSAVGVKVDQLTDDAQKACRGT